MHLQTALLVFAGICFMVLALVDTSAVNVFLGIIGLVMLILASWRWYSWRRAGY